MNKRILTTFLACALGGVAPGMALAAGTVTPAPIDPVDTQPQQDCSEEVLTAIDETRAECASDPTLCGIDIPGIIQQTRDECEKAPSLCNITLEDVLADATFGETEPNDHIVSADPLTNGVPITGQLYNAADEDWFYIEAPDPNSIITVWFENAPVSWQVSILDYAGNRLATMETVKGAEFSFDTSVAQAGTYYVVVTNTPGGTIDSLYQMSVIVNSSDNTNVEPSYNFHDVETEPNGLFSTADRILSDIVTYGQALYWNDLDLYRIDSEGNEILHMELCYANTSCYEDKSWAMFVLSAEQFDGTMVDDDMIKSDLETQVYDESWGVQNISIINPDGTTTTNTVDIEGYVPFASNHFYYLVDFGRFDDALVGKVDPYWGDETGIDLALSEPGTFYVAIVPTLKRDGETGSVLVVNAKPQKPDLVGLIAFPYNDDQYTFRVTRTRLDPSMATSLSSSARATLDMKAGKLTIPEVTYEGDLYKMDLRLGPGGGRTFILEDVTPVDPATLP